MTAEARATWRREDVTSSDGTRIALWRTGSGPPLVLVHGTTADHTRWARVAPALSAHFTLYMMDRRGRGGSGDARDYSLEQEGADVAAVVRHAGPETRLLGHSYGGLCALEAALLEPGLARLMLYEPPLPVGAALTSPDVLAELDALIRDERREDALVLFFRAIVGVPAGELDMLRSHPAWPDRVAAAHTIPREARVETAYRPDLERLRGLRTPTLLLLGGESAPAFRDALARLDALIPRSRIHVMPGQRHIAMDTAPEQFVAAVSAFATSDADMEVEP